VPTQPNDSVSKASSNNLGRHVVLYSLAAAAAGVSVLALAQPAAAEVVVTRKTIPIPMVPIGTVGPVRISMANNGINNFGFNLYNDSNSLISDRGLGVWPVSGRDGVIIGGSFYAKALALERGTKIGPSPSFFSFSGYPDLIEGSEIFTSGKEFRGFWKDSKDRYLGVRFLIGGQTHYGWIRLTVTTDPKPQGPPMSARLPATHTRPFLTSPYWREVWRRRELPLILRRNRHLRFWFRKIFKTKLDHRSACSPSEQKACRFGGGTKL
jgi:hypothetical protein